MIKIAALRFMQEKTDETVKYYRTDLLMDIEILTQQKTNAILWAARTSGTQIITPTTPEEVAMTYLEYYNDLTWYLLENLQEDSLQDFTATEIDLDRPLKSFLRIFYAMYNNQ